MKMTGNFRSIARVRWSSSINRLEIRFAVRYAICLDQLAMCMLFRIADYRFWNAVSPMFPFDIERALGALEGNEELLKDLASIFVEDAPILVNKVMMALTDNNSIQVRSAIHGLKSLVSTFYATSAIEIAQKLESRAAEGDLDAFRNGDFELLEKSIEKVLTHFKSLGWVDRL